MKNKIAILSLIFITWQMKILGRNPFDLPPQVDILDSFIAAPLIMPLKKYPIKTAFCSTH